MNDNLPQTAVILANGEYPTHAVPLEILNRADFVACCDGAANEYLKRGKVPQLIIGDGDSLLPEYREKYAPLVLQIPEQETNDLTKCIHYLSQRGVSDFVILGATGKREDHTLGNISLMIDYMRKGLQVQMMTDHGIFMPCNGDTTHSSYKGQQISIFNFGAEELHAEGLVYPLSDFTNWWQGTLNEAVGKSFTIHAKGDYLLFLNY